MIYAAAINQGLSPGTPIVDSGLFTTKTTPIWSGGPRTTTRSSRGDHLADSLAQSRNAATVRLLEKIGINPVLDLAQNSELPRRSPATSRWRWDPPA